VSEKSILKNDALSPDEKKLIHEIRTGNYKEIIIRKSKTDEDIRIEIKEDGMIEHNNIREIGSMLGNKGYKKISLTRRNEKQSYFEIIR
jgi:biopolymer transport protein ExbD